MVAYCVQVKNARSGLTGVSDILSLPETRFSLGPLRLEPKMNSLLSHVRLHLRLMTVRGCARSRAILQLGRSAFCIQVESG